MNMSQFIDRESELVVVTTAVVEGDLRKIGDEDLQQDEQASSPSNDQTVI